MGTTEIIISIAMVINKLIAFSIAFGSIWVLQTLMRDDRWRTAFPILDNYILRGALALVATGFGMDVFSAYVPSISEVVMNVGIGALLFLFYRQFHYKKEDHPFLKWKNKRISNQKNN